MLNQREIIVRDRMQSGYSYRLSAPVGENFADNFTPFYSPNEMLEFGPIAILAIFCAALASAKPFCNGRDRFL